MSKEISIEPLDMNNWLKVCKLSVSEEQKQVFPITNVYWIGVKLLRRTHRIVRHQARQ